jgi:carboxylesterase type B|tara:strand:+ start:2512 stop:2883 length:372 start_codon:yes stop_codon:yes gene_type:complete
LRKATNGQLTNAVLAVIPTQPAVPDLQLDRLFMKPVGDGKVLPALKIDAIANASVDGIAMMIGYPQDEMTSYAVWSLKRHQYLTANRHLSGSGQIASAAALLEFPCKSSRHQRISIVKFIPKS